MIMHQEQLSPLELAVVELARQGIKPELKKEAEYCLMEMYRDQPEKYPLMETGYRICLWMIEQEKGDKCDGQTK